jgi:hypothetical protein
MKRPIYSLILGTKTYIVLSSPTAVKDLLDKKSNIYSSRPEMYLGHDIVGEGRRFVTMVSNKSFLSGAVTFSHELRPFRNTAQCGDRFTK